MTAQTLDAPSCPRFGTPFDPASGLVWPDDVVTVLCRRCCDVVVMPASHWPAPPGGA